MVTEPQQVSNNEFFSYDVRGDDPLYETIRDSLQSIGIKAKGMAELLWKEYEPYADPDFRVQIAQDFQARFWEMYLTTSLLRAGCIVVKKVDPKGPDIHILYGNKSVWVEAVTPGSGDPTLPDSVPPFRPTPTPTVGDVPDEQLKLRILSAISDKNRKWQVYTEKGLIGLNDPYIIAVNTCKIPLGFVDRDPPRIVRCVFDIGHSYIRFNRDSGKAIESGVHRSGGIVKKS